MLKFELNKQRILSSFPDFQLIRALKGMIAYGIELHVMLLKVPIHYEPIDQ